MEEQHGAGLQHRLEGPLESRPLAREFLIWAPCDSWSRRARRKRERRDDAADADALPRAETVTEDMSGFFDSASLVCVCGVGERAEGTQEQGQGGAVLIVEFQWVYGRERALFESFVSHVGRRIGGG